MSKLVGAIRFSEKSDISEKLGRSDLLAKRVLIVRHKNIQVPSLVKILFSNAKHFGNTTEEASITDLFINPKASPAGSCKALLALGQTGAEKMLTAIQAKTAKGNRTLYDAIGAFVNAHKGTDFDYVLLREDELSDEDRGMLNEMK